MLILTTIERSRLSAGVGNARVGVAGTRPRPRAASPCLSRAALLTHFPALQPDRIVRAAASIITGRSK